MLRDIIQNIAFAFIIVRRNNAIRHIQRQLKTCINNPIYAVCRRRLMKEFKDLNLFAVE